MKHILVKSLGIISVVLLCCTLLCGVWVGTHEGSDLAFHATLSAVSVITAIISQVVYLLKCRHCGKRTNE